MTLRLDFQRGRVECVTCQVPVRYSGVGGTKSEGSGLMVEGSRRVIGSGIMDQIAVSLDEKSCCKS